MTQDEIIEMAKQASSTGCNHELTGDAIEEFAKLVAEREREACAKACEEAAGESMDDYEAGGMYCCAEIIRARGQE
jgi:hypothetical protein